MKSTLFIILLTLASFPLFSQASPVKWNFELSKEMDGQYKVTAKADIDDKWYIYSCHIEEGGPIPSSLTYDEGIKTTGPIVELSNKIVGYDNLFEMEMITFKKEAVFTQIVKPDSSIKKISGFLTFMTCDGGRCLPPSKIPFSLPIKS